MIYFFLLQETLKDDYKSLRRGSRSYFDDVFEQEINELINITQSHYEAYVSSGLCIAPLTRSFQYKLQRCTQMRLLRTPDRS